MGFERCGYLIVCLLLFHDSSATVGFDGCGYDGLERLPEPGAVTLRWESLAWVGYNLFTTLPID